MAPGGMGVGGGFSVAVSVDGRVGGGDGIEVADGRGEASGVSASGWKGVSVGEGFGLGVTVGGRGVETAGAGFKSPRPAQPAEVQARTVRRKKRDGRDEVRDMS
ncbi:MAG: hypothetical protein COY47_06310, partial [Chloroflexi bacterium CG_4_10_14_0_8_um_filter_57_5]